MEKSKIKRHERHIKALETAYEKMIDILQKDMDKKKDDNGNETVSLKDAQIKTFAEGNLKAAETANALLAQINEKEDELEKMKNPDGHKEKKSKKESEHHSDLNGRLK